MPNPLPFALTDAQLDIVRVAAESLDPDLRGPFLEAIARLLRDQPLGDGSVHRACAQMRREFKYR